MKQEQSKATENTVRRRGDKLLIPGLDLATAPEAVAERVAHLAPPGVRTVPLACDFKRFKR